MGGKQKRWGLQKQTPKWSVEPQEPLGTRGVMECGVIEQEERGNLILAGCSNTPL